MVKCFVDIFHKNENNERFTFICEDEQGAFMAWYEFMNVNASTCKALNGEIDFATFAVWTVDENNIIRIRLREITFNF